MNKAWSEENKAIQALLKKEATFSQGVARLLALRESLFAEILRMERELPREAFWQMPFAGAAGYHSKTLAYSIWHIFRIEDIVTHELITAAPQVLFAGDYLARIGADRPTTGNELAGEAIRDFSRQLDTKALLAYAGAVSNETAGILRALTFRESKRKNGRGRTNPAGKFRLCQRRRKRCLAGGLLVRQGCMRPGENAPEPTLDYAHRGHASYREQAEKNMKNAHSGVLTCSLCAFILGRYCNSIRCRLFCLGGLVQIPIAEIKPHVYGDFQKVQHIEGPAEIEQPIQGRGCRIPEHEFANDAKDIANPDEELKKQALSLSGPGDPGFPDGNGPAQAKAENHQGFQ